MFNAPRARKNYKTRRENPSNRDFVKLYRFTTESVEWLSEHFLDVADGSRGGALNSFTKMKIFLRYIADPGFQTGVGEDIGVSQPTVSNVVRWVAQKIVDKAHIWIRFPQDNEALQWEKQRWLRKFRFPTAIGAIDCTLIKIKKVSENRHGNEYICRKQFPAINVQATCNADEYFTSVSAEWPGSVHDSRIWKNSSICRVLRSFNNAVLIGDQGYGIEKCLMRAFRNPATPTEAAFNNLLKHERVIIERCFGQLEQRFPALQNTLRMSLRFIPMFIVACFVLHNVAKYLKDDAVMEEEIIDVEEDVGNDLDERNDDYAREEQRREGEMRRAELADIIFENV